MTELVNLPSELTKKLLELRSNGKKMVVLTGSGISKESGIPTFRGKEGYWTVGAKEYHPQEMATYAMFEYAPDSVWGWYLYRRGICRVAEPNAGHLAIAKMEQVLGDQFLLITQNVDGLHLRAGNSLKRTFQIHGNIDFARCDSGCGQSRWLLSDTLAGKKKKEPLTEDEKRKLRCPQCGGLARPHVLWFDECYDDENFHFHASLTAAFSADFLLVVGTSGATNLPMQVGGAALQHGATIVDINPDPNPFSYMAENAATGFFLQGSAGPFLTKITEALARG